MSISLSTEPKLERLMIGSKNRWSLRRAIKIVLLKLINNQLNKRMNNKHKTISNKELKKINKTLNKKILSRLKTTRQPNKQQTILKRPKRLKSQKSLRRSSSRSAKLSNNTKYKPRNTRFLLNKLSLNIHDTLDFKLNKTKRFFQDSKSMRNTWKRSPKLEMIWSQLFTDWRIAMKSPS